jgi:hypothetical protein
VSVSTCIRMASKTARLWEQLLDQLKDVASTGDWARGRDCDRLVNQLQEQPEVTAGTWRTLIQDMQVCA